MKNTFGTSFFVSRAKAVEYYADYSDNADAYVSELLREGAIAIGIKPLTTAGETLTVIDNGARYAITTA